MNCEFNIAGRKPLFSIIMPCYNSADYVERAIKGCINQTFENWELIIINDGSTDNTLDIIKSYASNDGRILVFSKENGGYISAVNYGLEKLNGEYFMLLGSDDELVPSLFTDVFCNLNEEEYPDMIAFRTQIINEDKTITEDKYSKFFNVVQNNKTNIKDFSLQYPQESNIFFTRDTSKMYKTELLGTLRYFGKKGMDADGIFSMLFAHKATSFLCVPTIGYTWYLRGESLSGRRKDYNTQVDRINNWIQFGNIIMTIDKAAVTKQEIYYITNYFYNIICSVAFRYSKFCFRDGIIKKVKLFFESATSYFNNYPVGTDIRLFLSHTTIWRYYNFLTIFSKKIKKYLKKR